MKALFAWLISLFTWPSIEPEPARQLAWGNKVSAAFREKVFIICAALGIDPDYLMACIAFETGGTFNPAERNRSGSGATGLIQFMPKTAVALGTTTSALAAMSALEQLDWVLKYFQPYAGRLKTLSDVYMAILWPKAIGKPENYVLWEKGTSPTTYRQNAGLDMDGDHDIEKQEAAAKVQAMLVKGRLPQNLWIEQP